MSVGFIANTVGSDSSFLFIGGYAGDYGMTSSEQRPSHEGRGAGGRSSRACRALAARGGYYFDKHREMLGTLAGRTLPATVGRRIVVTQDTNEINFAGREAKKNRRGLGPAGDRVSAGFFIHPLVAIDSEAQAGAGASICGYTQRGDNISMLIWQKARISANFWVMVWG